MGLNPGGKVLEESGLREGVITGSQSSYKDLGWWISPVSGSVISIVCPA